MQTVDKVRADALPEHVRYRDVGCDLQPHCLTCPLPVCKEELVQGTQAVRAYLRGLQIALLRSEGRTVEWIAQVMGITVRGVYKSVAKEHELGPLTSRATHDTVGVAVTTAPSNGRRDHGRQA